MMYCTVTVKSEWQEQWINNKQYWLCRFSNSH